jgi:DNA topoisomerase-1
MEGITKHRGYLTEDAKGFLRPSATGERVRDELVGTFSFMELDYTRHLEDQLDQIAGGKACYLDVVTATWQQLDSELQKLDVPGTVALKHACPSCSSEMRKKKGPKGFFWGCTAYPECKTSLPDVDGAPGERQAAPSAPSSEFTCTEDGCGKPLARRKGTGKKGAYDFWGCTGYPNCAATYRSDTDSRPVFSKVKSAAA